MLERGLKIFMTGGVALLCAFIVFGNIHDPGTNFLFVQHVLSMDTVLPSSAMTDHALPIPFLWQIGFWLIVLGEAVTRSCSRLGRSNFFGPVGSRRENFITPSGLFSPEPVAHS